MTPNDEDDTDAGPNELQNYPKLTSARTASGATKVKGDLNSVPELGYTLEFFMTRSRTARGESQLARRSWPPIPTAT